ncbi:hypothetical protein K502DRAFT_348932 [Neoconidiobolus thromboides FSU 785]|nr:hypothetical protein K502DRAFT_348932 [Neoconidiobolus thromboides FSU 785]
MNQSNSNNSSGSNGPLCRSCHQFPSMDQSYFCGHCISAQSLFNYAQNHAAQANAPNTSSSSNPTGSQGYPQTNTSSASYSQQNPSLNIPNFQSQPTSSQPRTQGPAPNNPTSNFFPFFSSLEGVSEQDFNNAVFSEAGNLNFLGQNFASALPPNFGNINSSSSPNLSSVENESSQQPSDSNRFSSPPYEEEDDLNGIWVGDRTCPDNVFYYGCFPGSLLGSTNKETQDICEKLAVLLQETHIEDDLAPPKDEIVLSTAAKRHLLDLYFRYHYPFFPVLHKPTIMSQFDLGKLPALLLNVIFAIAIFYTNEKSYNYFPQLKDKSHEEVAEEFEAQAKKCLDECFSEAEIFTIQALLLMTLYHHRTTVSNNVWLYSGMATRMAMELGLHKDCENLLNGAFEPVEQEIRKKTWWGCFVLDTLYSTMLGRPLSIQQELCDVKLPTLADDEDDPDEIPCTLVFIAMSKLGQIVGKLNRLLTSVKLKSNLQDRATRAHDCLVSLKNWFKSLPPSLKKLPESPPEDISNLKNCYAEMYLIPFLHSFYHTAIIVGQVLCHTDGLFRVTDTNLMGDTVNAATEIVRIMTRFDSFYAVHGLSFKYFPLYVSAFVFLHKIKVSSVSNSAQGQQGSADGSKGSEQWYSLFLSCLTTLNKFAKYSENGRYCMTVITGMAEHQKVKLPEMFKKKNVQPPTSNNGSNSNNDSLFSTAMASTQAMFGMNSGGIDPQTLNELAAMSQNGTYNLNLGNALHALAGSNADFNNPMLMANALGNNRSAMDGPGYQNFGQDIPMGIFNPENLMNLPTGISDQFIETVIGGAQQYSSNPGQVEELNTNQSHPTTQHNTTEVSPNSKTQNSSASYQTSSPQTKTPTQPKSKTTSQKQSQTKAQSNSQAQPATTKQSEYGNYQGSQSGTSQQPTYSNYQPSQSGYQQSHLPPQGYPHPQMHSYPMSHGSSQGSYGHPSNYHQPQAPLSSVDQQGNPSYTHAPPNQPYIDQMQGQVYSNEQYGNQQQHGQPIYGQVPNQGYYDPNQNYPNMNPNYAPHQYQDGNYVQHPMQGYQQPYHDPNAPYPPPPGQNYQQ